MNTDPAATYKAGWPQWLNAHRYHIAALFFLLVLALYAWLVYLSGERALLPTEQVALALATLFVSGTVAVLLTEVIFVRQANIASQLRRAHGIKQALRALQRDLGDARQRMVQRQGLDMRSIETLWDEISLHVQTELRVPIAEADRMIDDWGELDPATRNRIREEETKKQAEIEELYKELAAARSVQAELGEIEEVVARSMSAAVASLESRIREVEQETATPVRPFVPGSAKQLVTQGHYQKAVHVYDDIIRSHPTVHANYIGRARARALAGDMNGAMADLDAARDLYPDDPVTERVREQLQSGEPPIAPLGVSPAARQEMNAGNQALALGSAKEAATHYRNSLELGGNQYFALLDFAMCDVVSNELISARKHLEQLESPPKKSYMAANKAALEAICALLAAEDPTPHLARVQEAKRDAAPYTYSLSPLRFLEEGLRRIDMTRLATIQPVLSLLKGEPPEPQASAT